jgi:hypothetical protein
VLTVEALGFGDAENAGSNDPDGPDSKKKKKR